MSTLSIVVAGVVTVVIIAMIAVMILTKKILLPGIIMAVVLACGTFFFCYQVQLTEEEYTIELGEDVSASPEDYLQGLDFAVTRSEVITDEVDTYKVGSYDVIIHHAWQDFTVKINIQDTTPPSLEAASYLVCLQNGEKYDKEKFDINAYDLSGDVDVSLSQDRVSYGQAVTYDKNGEYELQVRARDINGNEAFKSVRVLVDTPPEFICNQPDYYLAINSEIDYMEGVTAFDEKDGTLTDKVVVDASAVDMSKPGNYNIKYYVEDQYGFSATTEYMIRVYERQDLQDLINTGKIDRHNQRIIGAYNLYDGGIYENDDVSAVLKDMKPAFVCLKKDYSNGGSSRGSGYIVEINDTEIVICTNQHVAGSYKQMDVYFYDATKVTGEVIGTGARACSDKDIAFVKVKRSDLSEEFLDTLKTVHIDEGYWNGLSGQPNIAAGLSCVFTDGSIWHEKTGKVTEKKSIMSEPWKNYGLLTHITAQLRPGTSGSAILDGHGNLVAMAVAHGQVDGVTKYFAVPLDNIISTYEKYIGHKPNYR